MIRVYGDSYAIDLQVDWQWYKQIAKAKKQDYYVRADFGVANEWICMMLFEDFFNKEIKPGDEVYVCMSACIRHWFLWDHPNVSNYQNMRNLPADKFGISQPQLDAIEMYYKHIQSGFIDSWKFDATTAWLNHYAKVFAEQDIKLNILQGFGNATDVMPQGHKTIQGDLFSTVCTGEFKSQKSMDDYYNEPIPDQRVNHMLKDNHKVLADALLSNDDVVNLNQLPWTKRALSINTMPMLKDQLSPHGLR